MIEKPTDPIDLRVTFTLKGEAAKAYRAFRRQYETINPSNSQMVQAIVLLSLEDGVACPGGAVGKRVDR